MDGASTFPAHFWTAPNSRGLNYGWGTAPGGRFVVFKSEKNGRFMSMHTSSGSYMAGDRADNGPWEKFSPRFLGNNLVAL